MKYVASVEIELTQDEIENLSKLSTEWSKDLPTTVRDCINGYCHEMLTMFAQAPDDDTDTE